MINSSHGPNQGGSSNIFPVPSRQTAGAWTSQQIHRLNSARNKKEKTNPDLFAAPLGLDFSESMCRASFCFYLGGPATPQLSHQGTTLDHSQGRLQMIDLFETQTDLLCAEMLIMEDQHPTM